MSTAPSEFDPAPRRAPALSAIRVLSLHERLVARDEQALAELIELTTPWLVGLLGRRRCPTASASRRNDPWPASSWER